MESAGKPLEIMLRFALFVLLGSLGNLKAQTYNYEITSGDISAAEGSMITGPSETLTGTFSLTADPANSNASITAYEVTALNFTSSTFSFVVAPSPFALTDAFANSTISFQAYTEASGAVSGAYSLISETDGVFGTYADEGPAPTDIYLADIGVAPTSGGLFVANIGILDATLVVPEPSTFTLVASSLLIVVAAARFLARFTPRRDAAPAAG